MAIRFSEQMRNILADAFGNEFNNGTLEIRTGSQPAAGAAATGTLLATIPLPADAFAAAASGAVAKNGTWSDTVDASGTAGWFRMISATTNRFVDGAIGAEMTLDNAALVAGGTVTVNTFTFTQPAQ